MFFLFSQHGIKGYESVFTCRHKKACILRSGFPVPCLSVLKSITDIAKCGISPGYANF